MRMRTFLLCGIASLAIAGAGTMAASAKDSQAVPAKQQMTQQTESTAPADEQTAPKQKTRHHKHHAKASAKESTPEEQEQTKNLNEQQLQKAAAANAAATPSAPPGGAVAPSTMPAMSPPAGEQQPASQPAQQPTPQIRTSRKPRRRVALRRIKAGSVSGLRDSPPRKWGGLLNDRNTLSMRM